MTKSKRTISRKCVVCGKRIKIIVYKDGHYNNGHYFNKLKIPIGKGQNKKVGTTKVLGKTIDVVKWTGKEKERNVWRSQNCCLLMIDLSI